MIRLGVGLDALVALREVAGGRAPDLLAAVHAVKLGGADFVVLQATAAKRPLTERDARWLVEAGVLPVHLRIEPDAALVAWAVDVRPAGVVLSGPAGAPPSGNRSARWCPGSTTRVSSSRSTGSGAASAFPGTATAFSCTGLRAAPSCGLCPASRCRPTRS